VDRVTIGLTLKLTLARWTGHHNTSFRQLKVHIGSTTKKINLPFDLGCLLVAHLYRIGAYGDIDPETLWSGPGEMPPILPEFLDQPLFRSVRGGGNGLRSAPDAENEATFDFALSAASFRHKFRAACEAVGLDCVEVQEDGHTLRLSTYAIRRGVATLLIDVMGPDRARRFLGHSPGSKALYELYDQGTEQVSLASVNLLPINLS
jgi:hypothetical protein